MKNSVYLLLLLPFLCFAQNQLIIEEKVGLVSQEAYNKMVTENFSYLLLSETSPQQGISATLNEEGSNLKINGLLYSGYYGILNMEADLTASNGVYFFDEEKGSQQAKISFNYFRTIGHWSKYKSPTPVKQTSNRMELLEAIIEAKSKHDTYFDLLSDPSIISYNYPELQNDLKAINLKVINKLKQLTARYINIQITEGFDQLPSRNVDTKEFLIVKPETITLKNNSKSYPITANGYNLNKLLIAYKANENYILNELGNKLIELELKAAESQWTSKHNTFYGITPFYERESFRRFTPDSTKTFANMFNETKGDLYGISFSLGYNYERKTGYGKKLFPYRFFIQASTTIGRASNRSAFSNSTLNISQSLGNDVNNNPITFTKEDAAFIGDTQYKYGTSNEFKVEAYYYPFNVPVGFFGRIGYQFINFSRLKEVDDKEISPMRLGILFNLKNKEKDKPAVVIQTFVDRSDLSLSPNGVDNDLRFGLGIGLPINVR